MDHGVVLWKQVNHVYNEHRRVLMSWYHRQECWHYDDEESFHSIWREFSEFEEMSKTVVEGNAKSAWGDPIRADGIVFSNCKDVYTTFYHVEDGAHKGYQVGAQNSWKPEVTHDRAGPRGVTEEVRISDQKVLRERPGKQPNDPIRVNKMKERASRDEIILFSGYNNRPTPALKGTVEERVAELKFAQQEPVPYDPEAEVSLGYDLAPEALDSYNFGPVLTHQAYDSESEEEDLDDGSVPNAPDAWKGLKCTNGYFEIPAVNGAPTVPQVPGYTILDANAQPVTITQETAYQAMRGGARP